MRASLPHLCRELDLQLVMRTSLLGSSSLERAGRLKDIYGVKITKEESGINYTRQLLDTRLVDDKLYFYPIANTELFKNDKLKQNPGWD